MQKQVISIDPGSSLNTFEVLISDGFLRDVFTVRIEIVTIGEDKVQMATSEDELWKAFHYHPKIVSDIYNLVHNVYQKRPVALPFNLYQTEPMGVAA
jgi:hypothetical protein